MNYVTIRNGVALSKRVANINIGREDRDKAIGIL
jgi:hypothetical protein